MRCAPNWMMLATAALLVSSLGACGDEESGSSSEPGSTPTLLGSPDVTDATTRNPGSFGDYSVEPRTFTSEIADVPFTIDVPGGWTARERDAGIAQFWEGEDEELSIAELTVMTNIAGPAAEVRREFDVALEGSASSPPRRARYGPYHVVEIDVSGALNGLPGGYRVTPEDDVTVVNFDVNGRGVTVVLDAFTAIEPPDQVARMLRQLREVLRTIRFT